MHRPRKIPVPAALPALCILCLAACNSPDMGEDRHTARFETHPARLFAVFESACSSPSETYTRLGPGVFECRKLLPPEETASLIVAYDGKIDDLPHLVLRLTADRMEGTAVLVRMEAYLSVPQKSGPALRVEPRSARVTAMVRDLLRIAGGVPL